MKKILLLVTVIFVTINIGAQSIFQPVSQHPYFTRDFDEWTADRNLNGIWLLRFAVGISGMETLYNTTENKLVQKGLIKTGGGISYAHYKTLMDGSIYNNFSLNAFVLTPVQESDAPISLALTVSALELLQAGINVTPKYFKDSDYFPVSLLFGLKYTF